MNSGIPLNILQERQSRLVMSDFVLLHAYGMASYGIPHHRTPTMFAHAFAYKQWADQRTLQAVATLDANVQSQALAFACQQLNHMLIVEELFRARLLGLPAPHAATNTAQLPALEQLESRLQTSDSWFADYAAALAPASRDEIIRFVFADGQSGSMSREEILFHILNHGTYHRGAIGHALERAGAQRPADTYTVYIHTAQPERRFD